MAEAAGISWTVAEAAGADGTATAAVGKSWTVAEAVGADGTAAAVHFQFSSKEILVVKAVGWYG